MQYGIGEIISDHGFSFFEKIHEPIFLLDRLGHIQKLNEAARKLLRIAGVNLIELEKFSRGQIETLFPMACCGLRRTHIGHKQMTLIARSFKDSDLVLVELRR